MKTKQLFSKTIYSVMIASAAMFGASTAFAQVKVGDNPTTIAAGSALEIESATKGLRLPQVALTSTVVFAPVAGTGTDATSPGMTVYNTSSSTVAGTGSNSKEYPSAGVGEYYWDGFGWVYKNGNVAQNSEVVLRIESSAAQTVNTTNQKINFGTVKFDKGSNFDLVNDEFVAPSAGFYLINLNVQTAVAGATNGRSGWLYLNGSSERSLFTDEVTTGHGYIVSVPSLLKLVAGDKVQMRIGTTSGSYSLTRAIIEITKLSN